MVCILFMLSPSLIKIKSTRMIIDDLINDWLSLVEHNVSSNNRTVGDLDWTGSWYLYIPSYKRKYEPTIKCNVLPQFNMSIHHHRNNDTLYIITVRSMTVCTYLFICRSIFWLVYHYNNYTIFLIDWISIMHKSREINGFLSIR